MSGQNQIEIVVKARNESTPALDAAKKKAREVGQESPTITVDADAAGAIVELEEVKHEADEVGRKSPNVRVDANTAGAVSKITALIGLISVLGVAAAGAAAAAGAGLGAGALAGGGALLAGFTGIGGAVSALGKHAAAAGGGGASTANAMRAANQGLVQSEHALGAAQQASRQAQIDLNTARVQARQNLADLQRQTEDMALSQRGAALSVQQAKLDLDATMANVTSTELQRQQAKLFYDEAVQHQKDLGAQAQQLAAKKATADKQGVSGSDLVRAAQQKVKDSAWQLAQAQQAVANAHRAVAQAGQGAAGGTNALNTAMAGLDPVARKFAMFLRGFIDGPLKSLQRAGQNAFLPGVQAGLVAIGPIMGRLEKPFARFSREFGRMIGDIIVVAGQLAGPLMDMASHVLHALDPGKGGLDGFVKGFKGFLREVQSSGALKGLGDLVKGLADGIMAMVPAGLKLFAILGPALGDAVARLGPVLAGIATALGPLLVSALDALLPLLETLGHWMADHPKIAMALVAALMLIGPAISVITAAVGAVAFLVDPIGLVVAGVAVLAGALVIAYQKSAPFRGFINGVAKAIKHDLWPALQDAWKSIVHGVSPAFERLQEAVRKNKPQLDRVAKAVGALFRIWLKVQLFMDGLLFKALGNIAGFIGGYLIDRVTDAVTAVGQLVDVFDWLRRNVGGIMSSVGTALGKVPGFAHGGITGAATGGARGGLHWVGEHGPELLNIPGGSMVHSNPDSMRMAGNGGAQSVEITFTSAGATAFEKAIVEIMRRYVNVKGGSVQAALGRT